MQRTRYLIGDLLTSHAIENKITNIVKLSTLSLENERLEMFLLLLLIFGLHIGRECLEHNIIKQCALGHVDPKNIN
jgi:hypothetical protein